MLLVTIFHLINAILIAFIFHQLCNTKLLRAHKRIVQIYLKNILKTNRQGEYIYTLSYV